MRKRSKARELALQILYQIEITKDNPQKALDIFWAEHETDEEVKEFATTLVKGAAENIAKIDRIIDIYKDAGPEVPEKLFDILESEKIKLEEIKKEKGSYISPLDF